jgi:hypothetical protein
LSAHNPQNPFVFQWPVDRDGYALVRVGGDKSGYPMDHPFWTANTLLSSASAGYDAIRRVGGPLQYYFPLEDAPGLWRQFAEKCTGLDGVLSFVSEFGLLTNTASVDGRELGDTPDAILGTAERIRYIAALLDAGNRRAAADTLIEYPPRVIELLRWNDRAARPETILVPVDLRHALLHQAAETIAHNYQWRPCGNDDCPQWFRIGTGAATARREYCSNRCRVAASRRRAAPDQPTKAARVLTAGRDGE